MGVTVCTLESDGKRRNPLQTRCTMLKNGPGFPSFLTWPDRERLAVTPARSAIHSFFLAQHDDHVATGEGARDLQLARVEAALFASRDPLPARRLAHVAQLADGSEARRQIRRLQALYDQDGSAFEVVEVAGGFQLLTRPPFYRWLAHRYKAPAELRLSGAALETLAVVSYRQPITRADIEAIRGVQVGELLRVLMERGLIRIAGRHDSLGRPVLYGTTRKFLQVFGLKSLRDMPELK